MARKKSIDRDQLNELLLQAMETELGGEQVYKTALLCAQDERLQHEWSSYLEQTQQHQVVVSDLVKVFGLDPEADSAGRRIVRSKWLGLIGAMEIALASSEVDAELVAAECVVEAETKDHLNWELLSLVAADLPPAEARAVRSAVQQVEGQEDEHLYHTAGWCRELWLAALGVDSVLPPPEERRDVKTAIGAARAMQQRDQMT